MPPVIFLRVSTHSFHVVRTLISQYQGGCVPTSRHSRCCAHHQASSNSNDHYQMSSAAVSMNSADLDLILRERNDYRRQAAKLRQENVSLQGRLATMENLLDEMKCENTDLKLRIASVQQMESGHDRQAGRMF